MDKGSVAKPTPIAFAALGPFNDASGENFADLLSRSINVKRGAAGLQGMPRLLKGVAEDTNNRRIESRCLLGGGKWQNGHGTRPEFDRRGCLTTRLARGSMDRLNQTNGRCSLESRYESVRLYQAPIFRFGNAVQCAGDALDAFAIEDNDLAYGSFNEPLL